jgi:hypothetical protein
VSHFAAWRALVPVALSLVLAALPAAGAERDSGTFDDDDGIPAERAIEWLAAAGVLDGCNPPANTAVCPDRILTRAEAAKVLVLLGRHQGLLSETRPGTLDHFVDDDLTWGGSAQPLIGHLADLAIVHGCDPPANTRFCPDAPLLRGQVAKMTVNTLELDAPADYEGPWTDTAGAFFHESARVAAYHGLWDASTGRFGGHRQVSRAEFARTVVAAVEPGLCNENPFTDARVEGVGERHASVSLTAYAYDLQTGCAYWMNPDARQQTASVLKVMVMAGTLLEAQETGRPPTAWEMSQLTPMITESADPPVRSLWNSFGGSPWFADQAETFGLSQTTAIGDDGQPWGRTRTSALDQANLLRQVLLGEWGPLEAGRSVATDLMTSVVPSQTWGVTAGVPDDRVVAQKNGFAAGTANSVGVVYDAAGEPDYIVAVLTIGWPSWEDGVPVVEEIAAWVTVSLSSQ